MILIHSGYLLGIFAPRKGADGRELPNARSISVGIISNRDAPRTDITLMLMVFGQFIDHDLALAPIFVLRKFCLINSKIVVLNIATFFLQKKI